MARTLLDITADLKAFDDLLDECGGDITTAEAQEAIESWFHSLDLDLKDKVDGYCALISEYILRADARAKEAERMLAKSKRDAANASWLKERLQFAFESRNLKKLDTDRYTISLVNNGGAQPIDIHSEVPDEWTIRKVEVVPDRPKIRAALERGESLPFATLQERGRRLSIR